MVLSESVLDQNGPSDHFGQNGLIPNWISAFVRPKWTKMVHFGPFWPGAVNFGPFWSANRTLAFPDLCFDLPLRHIHLENNSSRRLYVI